MLYLIPFVAAFTGWLIHRIAIYFLFKPLAPVNVLGMHIQGILPKNKKAIAIGLGKTVQEKIPFEMIGAQLSNEATIKKIMPQIDSHIDDFLRNKLKEKIPMLAMFIGDSTIASIKDTLMGEIEILLPTVIKSYINNLEKDINLAQLASEQLDKVSDAALNDMLQKALAKPLNILAWLGAANGFVVGCITLCMR